MKSVKEIKEAIDRLDTHHLDSFVEAISLAIGVGGDCDTHAAIVGGIVALSVGRDGIPADWLEAREPIQM